VVVKGTRGNEGAERSGVHDEEQWTKDRALGDTTGGCVPGRQVSYTLDTEVTHLTSADNHASTSPLKFFTGQMLFLMPNQ